MIPTKVSATTSLVVEPQRGEGAGFGSIMVTQILALKTPPQVLSTGARQVRFIHNPE
jgi:hypothetical protein